MSDVGAPCERRPSGDESRDTVPAVSGFDHADGGRVHYGGQAVIEGVMMRGPTLVATAVRLPNGEISIDCRDFVSASRRHRILRLPVVRGGLTLIESLTLGIRALNYSASVAIEASDGEAAADEAGSEGSASGGPAPEAGSGDRSTSPGSASGSSWKTNAALSGTMILAFALGIVIFFWVPMVLSDLITRVMGSESGVLFNLIDGVIRVTFFLVYLWAISRWKEMRRVFEYHGAEHRVIFTEEAGEELTPENARLHTTRHPRCGTSFLLIVMVVSILVFMIFGKPPTMGLRLARLLLIPVIAGISYEIMKVSARKSHQRWARLLSTPGVWLQRITTKEPSDDQVRVAIAALEAVRIGNDDAREAQVS